MDDSEWDFVSTAEVYLSDDEDCERPLPDLDHEDKSEDDDGDRLVSHDVNYEDESEVTPVYDNAGDHEEEGGYDNDRYDEEERQDEEGQYDNTGYDEERQDEEEDRYDTGWGYGEGGRDEEEGQYDNAGYDEEERQDERQDEERQDDNAGYDEEGQDDNTGDNEEQEQDEEEGQDEAEVGSDFVSNADESGSMNDNANTSTNNNTTNTENIDTTPDPLSTSLAYEEARVFDLLYDAFKTVLHLSAESNLLYGNVPFYRGLREVTEKCDELRRIHFLSPHSDGVLNEITSEIDFARVKLTNQYTSQDSAPKALFDHSQEQCQEESKDCPVAEKFQKYVEETKLIRQEIVYIQNECQGYRDQVEQLKSYQDWYRAVNAIRVRGMSARSQPPRFDPPADCRSWFLPPISPPSNVSESKTETVPVCGEGPWNQVKTHLEDNYTGEHYSTPRQDTSVNANSFTPPVSNPALRYQLPRLPPDGSKSSTKEMVHGWTLGYY